MYEFFKRNNKKLMAVFAVVLMVAFLMPNFQRGATAMNPSVGTLNGKNVLRSQVQQAQYEWEVLGRRLVVQSPGAMGGQGQWQSILRLIPPSLAQSVETNPATYFLLQQEARDMGMTAQFGEADRILEAPQYAVVNSDKRILPANQSDEDVHQAARAALANLIMVLNAHGRAMSVIKVSEPLLKHEISLRLQQIKVRLVDFPAKDFQDKVPAATTEQLQAHFEKYAKLDPGGPESETNLFGYGYKYPNRVKIQYLSIPRDEVRKVIKATKTDYDWEVEAQRYYISHQSEFPTTAPAPTTQDSLVLLPTPAQPTTQPFEKVRGDIVTRIVEPLVDRLQLQIQSDITSRLSQDYQKYEAARPPTTGPASAPSGAALESFEYLQKLAADMQTRHKVTLTIVSVADSFKTAGQLNELKDIGKLPNFGELAVASAEPFVNESDRKNPVVLSLFEPSRATSDDDKNVFVYRLTGTEATHAPASLDEVKTKVEEDWKRAQAYDLAKQDAQKLLDSAKAPGLDVVAADKMKYIGPFSANTFMPIDGYKLSTRAQQTFVSEAYKLMSVVNIADGPRPITLIGMPGDEKLAVVELVQIESSLTPETAALAQSLFAGQIMQQYEQGLATGWFNPNSIFERLHYKDLTAPTP